MCISQFLSNSISCFSDYLLSNVCISVRTRYVCVSMSHWFNLCVSGHHELTMGVCGWEPDVCLSQCLTGSIFVFQITMSVQWVYVGGDQMCVYLSVSLVPSLCFRSPRVCSGCMWVGIRCVCISVSHWFHLCVSDHHEHAVGVCGWGPDVCVSQCLTGSISVFQITTSMQWVYVGGDQMCVYLSVSLVPSLCFRSPWACSGCMWVGTRCVCISVSHWFHLCVSDHHEHAVGVCGWGPDVCVSQCLTGSISVFQITMSVQWVYVGEDQMCVYLSVSLVPSLCFRSPWVCSGCMWVGTRCVCISVSHWFHLCVSDHHECAVGVCGWGPDVCVSQCLTGSISVFQITMSVLWVYVGGDQMCVYLSVSLVPSLCFRSPWACSGCMWGGDQMCVYLSVSLVPSLVFQITMSVQWVYVGGDQMQLLTGQQLLSIPPVVSWELSSFISLCNLHEPFWFWNCYVLG